LEPIFLPWQKFANLVCGSKSSFVFILCLLGSKEKRLNGLGSFGRTK
jgi:hypothetical protein